MGGGDREAVDVVGTADPPHPLHELRSADGEADAQTGQAGRLGQGAQHQKVGNGGEQVGLRRAARPSAAADPAARCRP